MTAVTQESLLALIQNRKNQASRTKTIKPITGRGRYRVLPGWKWPSGDPRFYIDFGQHFVKDASNQVKAVYICADKTFGRPCQVCDTIAAGIAASTDDATKRRLEDARSSGRVLLNVLHLDGPTPNEVQILEVAPSVLVGKKGVGGILGIFSEWPNMLDLANGNDIIIEKAGTSKNDTTYSVQIAGASKPVDPSVLNRLHDLDKFVAVESEEAMRRALTSVHAISGLLPAPSAVALPAPQPAADIPATPAPAMMAPIATAPAPTPTPTAPTAPAASPAAPVTPVTARQSTGDRELDELLAGLG